MCPDRDAVGTNDERAVETAIGADADPTGRLNEKGGQAVGACTIAEHQSRIFLREEPGKAIGSINIDILANLNVGWELTGIPVMSELKRRTVHVVPCSIKHAGLPATVAPGGTSWVTTAPGAMIAPLPIRTPFRIVAL